ncbi:uracil-DNA glycosylase family 4 [Natronospira proteinivora]|uniref:Type-5 uracil-DNA glycosylase n=1 Tax=Natronospira proteinivora TaxID=1807133 RepID=A0ABT1G696_9GAMM|nr:uracil-DNA glycosylase [Natronospira proteinivora]MCP1726815.1 uracil-DNA glycosylase family 4 [Natronospira proteinivora]
MAASPLPSRPFRPDCRACPRLRHFLARVRDKHPDYHAAPVAPFGPEKAPLLIVGLAPGMHGANATGRPFTGDFAGILLYKTLHELGLASRPVSEHADDGLKLKNCRITNAVKCLPPENKPTGNEVKQCAPYLRHELERMPRPGVLLALGKVAHDAVLRVLGYKLNAFKFAHGAEHVLDDRLRLIDSYHCSRYNTQTGRLTEAMFRQVVKKARSRIES